MARSTGMLYGRQHELAFVYRFLDVSVILAGLWIAMEFRGVTWSVNYVLAGVLASIFFYGCAQGNGVYKSWRAAPFKESAKPLLLSWLMTVFVLLILAYATKTTAEFSRIAVGAWILVVPVVLLGWRAVFWISLRGLRKRGYNTRSIAVAGATKRAMEVISVLNNAPHTGMIVKGFYDDNERRENETPADAGVPYLGNFDNLIEEAKKDRIDIIYIALPMQSDPEIQELLSHLSDSTVSVYFVPDFQAFDLMQSRWVQVGPLATVSVFETPFLGIDGWAKRIEDIVLSALIIVMIAVPMMVIALAIKVTSRGPVIFKQERYGLSGRRFMVFKFRTMNVEQDGDQVAQARENDPRVTPIGVFLRKTSLDELPQFINVLIGDMSIVGPRPHAVVHNEEYRKLIFGYMLRHKVKPGITGWAQINGWRGETETLDKMEKRIEYDLWYIRNWSLWLDLKLIVKTIYLGFRSPVAY